MTSGMLRLTLRVRILLLFVCGRDLTEGVTCEVLMHLVQVISHDEHLRAEVVDQIIIHIVVYD